jgi:TetR/AcrR family transcriptional regulator
MEVKTSKRMPAEKRRQSILDAALTILSERGYEGMTTARVARKVGVAEPILYRHFPSKKAILRALLDEVIGRMMFVFHDLIKDETDAVAALRRVCGAYPELSKRYEREFRVINQTLVEVNDPKAREVLSEHYHAYHAFLQKLIERGQHSGALRRDIPASIGAWHVIHSALGYLMMLPVHSEVRSVKNFESLTDAVLGGLMKIA